MKQTVTVEGYGDITFNFPATKEETFELIDSIEKDDAFQSVMYDVEDKSSQEVKEKELNEMRELVDKLYEDCEQLATKDQIEKYNKKKNGKFKKGATNIYKYAENATLYDCDYTNNWTVFTIYGKATSENEIDVNMTLKSFVWN